VATTHTYAEMQALARPALPGVRYRRTLLWRYSLAWAKPMYDPDSPRPLLRIRRSRFEVRYDGSACPRSRTAFA
jgi:hypothetical protein